ncbi:RHS repeat-associated protein [Chryseobacterium sp. 52]|nr:RHS repeat-associated protein [Chryseobacterium sp. 52]
MKKNRITTHWVSALKKRQKSPCFSVFALLFSFTTVFAQTNLSTAENYVYTKSCMDGDCIKKSETVQYFDGLGRPIQTVAIKATPLGRDVVIPVEYDAKGRQAKSYLPVPQAATANGAIYTNPLGNASSAGYGNEKIYAEKRYDDAFTGRVSQVVPAGTAWSQKPAQMAYATNTEGEVKKYKINTHWTEGRTDSEISLLASYPANQLMKTSVTDPDGNTSTEFKNGKGQTILVRKNDGTQNVDTYYLHNEYGQLVYVIPPLALGGSAPDQTMLDKLCYQYRYDGLGRLVEKKVPGKGWEWMIYDKQDRLVGAQDAVMRTKSQWMYTKYDRFGRVTFTGINSGGDRMSEQANADAYGSNNASRTSGVFFNREGMDVYYDPNGTYPGVAWVKLLSVNYYDTYPAYSFNPAFPSAVLGESVISDTQNASVNTQAMPTLSLVKNIEDDNWTKTYAYYDKKGRSIGSYTINHLGGYTRTETELDFAGAAQQTKVYHKRLNTDTEKVISQSFDYDSQNRMIKHRHQVGSGPVEVLTENTYNELSQLSNKKVGGGLESIDYQYDIRGALTKINDPAALGTKLFGYAMKYQNPEYANVAPGKSNGNISEIDWKSASDGILKRYSYVYDPLNRLKDAIYAEPGATAPHNNNYNEHATYDLHGNIKTLRRNAFPVTGNTATMVDDLVYQYTGNRLDKVIENAMNDTGYEGGNNGIDYDDNGNMITMKDKGMQSIGYNFLSQPDQYAITQATVLGTNSYSLNYLYRADGTKLRKTYFKPSSGRGSSDTTRMTDYLDGFQYSYFEGGGPCLTCRTETAFEMQAYKNISELPGIGGPPEWKLDFVPTAEGFYSFTENRYIYQYKDHLGNTRVSFARNSAGAPEILDTSNYYPFGLNHTGGNGLNSSGFGSWQSYKYNGKELQETGMYDFGARMYMADLGRWGVIDPLAEQMRRYSPYNFAFNNPISFIDPDGMAPRQFAMAGDSRPDAYSGDNNPNWLGLGNSGGSYGQLETSIGGGGNVYQTDEGTVYTGSAAKDAFSALMSGNTKPPRSSFWKRAGNFIRGFFGGNKGAGITSIAAGATISRTGIQIGEIAFEGYELSTVGSVLRGFASTGTMTLGAILYPTMIKEPEFNWTRDLPLDVPVTTTGEPQDPNLYLYRIMKNVNGMPMVGDGLDKLGLRDRDINNVPSSTMITPLFPNGLSVTVGYGSIIPPNVPDFTNGKGTLFKISASSLISYGLVGLPVPNPKIPNYGQIRPAVPMNVGTFRALIYSTSPAWQPIK